MALENKLILVTGGTGSFGQKFTEIVLREHNPKVIRVYSRGEFLQQEMQKKFSNDQRLRFFIGDVRDRERIYRAMNGVDIVVHAAALKQIPACEYNPIEAVKTNVDGTANVIDAAINNNVEKVISISTDKAVQPINLYGATKLVAEKLTIQANFYSGGRQTKFSCVRYGNVIGSRGSVIPLFVEQEKDGEITITDENMMRFLITLDQGVNFVISFINRMNGGEIFVPKIPSMRITDLADVVTPKAKKKIIGIRPGEKLNEILLTKEEALHAREFDNYFIIEPEHIFWNKEILKDSKPLQLGFNYTSDNNSWRMTKDELKKLIVEI